MLALWELYPVIKEGVTVAYHLIFTQNCQNKYNKRKSTFSIQRIATLLENIKNLFDFLKLNWKVIKILLFTSIWYSSIWLELVNWEAYGMHLWLFTSFSNLSVCFIIPVWGYKNLLHSTLHYIGVSEVYNEKMRVNFVS